MQFDCTSVMYDPWLAGSGYQPAELGRYVYIKVDSQICQCGFNVAIYLGIYYQKRSLSSSNVSVTRRIPRLKHTLSELQSLQSQDPQVRSTVTNWGAKGPLRVLFILFLGETKGILWLGRKTSFRIHDPHRG